VLEKLNVPALEPWRELREESAAPRNSRELAVRNQFFTPRYVVEFLTDNTLGRIWYEMIRGKTRLKALPGPPNDFGIDPTQATQIPNTASLSAPTIRKAALDKILLNLCGAISYVEFWVITATLACRREFFLHIKQDTQIPRRAVSIQ
jgi:hypothetical protein